MFRQFFNLLPTRMIRIPPVAVAALSLGLTATATYYSYYVGKIYSFSLNGQPNFVWVFIIGMCVSFLIYIYAMTATRYAVSLEKSQTLTALIANSMPALVAYIDPQHCFRYVNKAYQEWLDIPREDLMGQPVGILLGPRYEKFFRPLMDRALAGERLEFEYSVDHMGGLRAMRSQYIPDYTPDGDVAGFVALISDVTEQKAFQDRLRDERRISELVNEVGLSLRAELDPDKLSKLVTDVATELTGAEAGAFFFRGRDPRGEETVQHIFSGPIQTKFTFSGERTVRLDDISNIPEYAALHQFHARSYLAVPVVSRSGEVLGGLFFIHSRKHMFSERAEKLVAGIAAQAAVAIDNAKLLSEAQSVNRVKDEFLATLSHELRTPMNVILGYSELLQDEDLPAHVLEHADAIHRNAKAQNQLIADLLDISAIITGKLNFQPSRISGSDAVRAAVENIRFSAETKGVHLVTDVDNGCQIYGDPTRIQQIIWNLLSNAVKFTPRGGRVLVRNFSEGTKCTVVVQDSGIGIDSEFLPYVFDRFRQEDSGSSRRFGGLGLGLSIVRQLVELHGGSIRVESGGKNQGSTFTFSLPLANAEQPAEMQN